MSVRITFLGGLGEIGRNCAALEVDGKIAMIDCGLMFPEEEMLGVDLVLPDWSWLKERSGDVRCVVLTHGHEDHVGSLAYFLQDINVPVAVDVFGAVVAYRGTYRHGTLGKVNRQWRRCLIEECKMVRCCSAARIDLELPRR